MQRLRAHPRREAPGVGAFLHRKSRFKEATASFPLLYLAPDRLTALLEVRAFLGHPRTDWADYTARTHISPTFH